MLEELEIKNEKSVPRAKLDSLAEIALDVDPSISYNEFFVKFLLSNSPCLFRKEATELWPCRQEWLDAQGTPHFEHLTERFGETVVPVADCNQRYYDSQTKKNETMKNYVKYWKEYRARNYPAEMPLLYLKDWHCMRLGRRMAENSIYTVPRFFASDWLNEYYEANAELDDDYMFVYMGPKGTWTPFHADVFGSYSWSANVTGKKRWLLFPPREEDHLRDATGCLPYDASERCVRRRRSRSSDDQDDITYFEIMQNSGEILFVPSGWHHQVSNLEDAISINHNWINGCNIHYVWRMLRDELGKVTKEIEDCRDMENWHEHCQLMLKTSHGMDYAQFYDMLRVIARRRLDALDRGATLQSFSKWTFGVKHRIFDLLSAREVLGEFAEDVKNKDIGRAVYRRARESLETLLGDIDRCLATFRRANHSRSFL